MELNDWQSADAPLLRIVERRNGRQSNKLMSETSSRCAGAKARAGSFARIAVFNAIFVCFAITVSILSAAAFGSQNPRDSFPRQRCMRCRGVSFFLDVFDD